MNNCNKEKKRKAEKKSEKRGAGEASSEIKYLVYKNIRNLKKVFFS